MAEARATRGPVGHEAVDAACERIRAEAAEAARNAEAPARGDGR
ncbi:hypothetical protein [Methylobacterium currus]|nr:hypothetical protein [Methylobacterium currus]